MQPRFHKELTSILPSWLLKCASLSVSPDQTTTTKYRRIAVLIVTYGEFFGLAKSDVFCGSGFIGVEETVNFQDAEASSCSACKLTRTTSNKPTRRKRS